MEKFIPYEKLSKRQKREYDKERRTTWGAISPVTRKPENPKAYNRKKARRQSNDLPCGLFDYPVYPFPVSAFSNP